jgi:hypothetical protein
VLFTGSFLRTASTTSLKAGEAEGWGAAGVSGRAAGATTLAKAPSSMSGAVGTDWGDGDRSKILPDVRVAAAGIVGVISRGAGGLKGRGAGGVMERGAAGVT